jgi:hypothetical protein
MVYNWDEIRLQNLQIGKCGKAIQFQFKDNGNHPNFVFIILFLLSITSNWLYNIYYICITLQSHWWIQRIGTSRIFCQNRVEIVPTASPSLKTKNIGGPSLPLWIKLNGRTPFENAWIGPCDVFELEFLVQFMGEGGGRALLLYKRIFFFFILTEKQ